MDRKKTIQFTAIEPPQALYGRIMHSIEIEKARIARKLSFYSMSGLIGSVVVSIFATMWLWMDATSTGFFQTISLLFSDSNIILNYGGDFFSLVIESIPYFSFTACLASLAMIILSMKYFFQSKKEISFIKLA